MNDTSPEFEKMYREKLLALSPEKRIHMSAEMGQTARRLFLSNLDKNLSPIEIKVALLKHFYPDLPQNVLDFFEAKIRT